MNTSPPSIIECNHFVHNFHWGVSTPLRLAYLFRVSTFFLNERENVEHLCGDDEISNKGCESDPAARLGTLAKVFTSNINFSPLAN